MKSVASSEKRKAVFFAAMATASFFAIFFLAPLGGFTIWITVGATIYFTFMTIYSLVPHRRVNPNVRQRHDPKREEMNAYIRRHTTILVSLFVVTAFFVLIFLLFVL